MKDAIKLTLSFFLLFIYANPVSSQVNESDSLELVNFYTTACQWGCTLEWNFGHTINIWEGVEITNGRVTSISVYGLKGQLVDLNLPNLIELDLAYGELNGTIPDFSNLPNLEALDLQWNNLSGTIPDFSALPNLTGLSLRKNNLTGTIPDFTNLPNLTWIDLRENSLIGVPDFTNFPVLEALSLSENSLTGTVTNFTNLPNLKYLNLDNNNLTGAVPEFNLPETESIILNNNNLTGSIPILADVPNLNYLDVSYNQLSGCYEDTLVRYCGVSHRFHDNPGLPNNGNNFYAFCNDGAGSCLPFNVSDSLELVNFYNTACNDGCWLNWNLSQPAHTWDGVTIRGSRVTVIDADNRGLNGNLPDFNLPYLKRLSLYYNNLQGQLPDFTNLPRLEHLNLSSNDLSGCIPDELTRLCGTNSSLGDNDNLWGNGDFAGFCVRGTGNCTPINPSDSLEVVNFYTSACTEDCYLNWDLNEPIHIWQGITTGNGRVQKIDLEGKRLSGNLPDFNLPDLIYLNLEFNRLEGNLPGLSNLNNLQNIYLNRNRFTGCFPETFHSFCDITYDFSYNFDLPNGGNFAAFCNEGIGDCTPINPSDSLELVSLYNATCNDGCTLNWDFAQPIYNWEGITTQNGHVVEIYLDEKGLSGNLPNVNLPNLTRLHIRRSQLDGNLPNLNLPNLTHLNFNRNDFVGNIPDFDLPNLTHLDLSYNDFTGGIPQMNLPNLTYIDLGYNSLEGCFPTYLNEYCDIQAYFDSYNNLPQSGFGLFCSEGFGDCTPVDTSDSLELVNFYNTNCTNSSVNWDLEKSVLTWEGVYVKNGRVIKIDLYNQHLKDTLPNMNLPELTHLNLEYNDLEGNIPEFNHLVKLEDINLSWNNLTGSIPPFTNSPDLNILDLSDNQLSGCYEDALIPLCDISYNFSNNPELSNSGNFGLFCEQGLGDCYAVEQSDSLELVNFYNTHCGTDCTLNWDFAQPVRTWQGISVGNGRVVQIYLPSVGLTGSIPVLNLPELTFIHLRHNNLSGCFSEAVRMYCDIGYSFSGNSDLPGNGDFNNFCNLDFGACVTTHPSDSLELVNFYNSSCNENCTLEWDFNQRVSSWKSVIIENGRVVSLRPTYRGLSGNIPDFNLPELRVLHLGINQFSGNIPNFSNLTKLESLGLGMNNINGSLPDFNLPELRVLSISLTGISDTIPDFNLPKLEELNLNSNNLSGSIPVFTYLENLQEIVLSGNNLSGCFDSRLVDLCDIEYDFDSNNLPSFSYFCNGGGGSCYPLNPSDSLELVKLYNETCQQGCTLNWNLNERVSSWTGVSIRGIHVREINLSSKYLSGSIPDLNFPELIKLNLGGNELTGEIPHFDMPKLEELNLNFNELSGPIPNFNLPNLIRLYLYSNELTGEIPDFNFSSNLQSLNLRYNQLTGQVPDFSHTPALKSLSIQGNQLTGTIPNFNLPDLVNLEMGNNQLTGSIPTFNMLNLERLYLEKNQLTDSIPAFDMPDLDYLDLSENQLTGTIPDINLSRITYAFLDRNQLSGTIPRLRFYGGVFINHNNFSHQDITANYAYNSARGDYIYSPQYFGNEQFQTDTIGATVVLSPKPSIPYEEPSVRWLQNEKFITPNYALNDTTYLIPSLDTADIGVYQYRFIDYTLSPEVEFHSRPINNYVEGLDLEGEPIIQGELILEYGIEQSPTKIDSIRNELITEYGGVILDSCGCAVQLDLWKFGEDTLDIVREVIGVDGGNERRTSSTEIDGNRDNLFVPDYNEAEYILIGDPIENPNDTAKVVVGVIDTGINVYHNAIYDNLWSNSAEKDGTLGIDDDQNGYVDDVFGYDFINDSLMRDGHGHGTKVGGVITANTPEDMDIQVMPVRTFNDEGRGSLFNMLCGVYYAIDNGSDIINISAGYKGEKSVILQKALQYGRDRNVLFVVSAGNDTLDLNAVNYWPATFTRDTTLENTVITVTSVDSTYNLAEYANYGDTTITIATSGQSILAPAEYDLESFDYIGGTSASTPIVSLALGIEKIKNPTKSRASLREDFLNNADIVADLIDAVEEGRMLNVETRLLSKLKVLLEGALLNPGGTYDAEMKTTLNNRGLLPGQNPLSPLATPTPSGQPYTASPWDYTGTEWGSTDYYLEDRVDWVLVSLRTERESDSEIYRTAAQLKKDGTVEFYRPIMDLAGIADSVYIVVEHRNHMAVMSPEKVPVSHGRFVYDFTAEDSFRNPTAVGQIEIVPGVWAMIVGDSSQENDFPHYDINGDDKAIWVDENGNYDQYMPSDYNMDGDVNGNDKAIWSGKIGLSNRVPK